MVGSDVCARYAVMSACIFQMQESGWYHGLCSSLLGRVFLFIAARQAYEGNGYYGRKKGVKQ